MQNLQDDSADSIPDSSINYPLIPAPGSHVFSSCQDVPSSICPLTQSAEALSTSQGSVEVASSSEPLPKSIPGLDPPSLNFTSTSVNSARVIPATPNYRPMPGLVAVSYYSSLPEDDLYDGASERSLSMDDMPALEPIFVRRDVIFDDDNDDDAISGPEQRDDATSGHPTITPPLRGRAATPAAVYTSPSPPLPPLYQTPSPRHEPPPYGRVVPTRRSNPATNPDFNDLSYAAYQSTTPSEREEVVQQTKDVEGREGIPSVGPTTAGKAALTRPALVE